VIGYWINKQYFQPPEDNPDDIALYKVHVANATVPRKGIPYTKQLKPVRKIPDAVYVTNPATYIRQFEQPNHLKEIPQ
jgi:hypothetical protein